MLIDHVRVKSYRQKLYRNASVIRASIVAAILIISVLAVVSAKQAIGITQPGTLQIVTPGQHFPQISLEPPPYHPVQKIIMTCTLLSGICLVASAIHEFHCHAIQHPQPDRRPFC
jgi:hypothetical protein